MWTTPFKLRTYQAAAGSSHARFHRFLLTSMMAMLLVFTTSLAASAQANRKHLAFCGKLGSKLQASSGAQMYCFGPQQNGAAAAAKTLTSTTTTTTSTPKLGSNVDAATVSEDVTPSGVQMHGQSEVSVAAAGPYVVEAWNDSTGFFAPCGSVQNKEELTGLAFSNNGGASFVDLGGVPNANCNFSLAEGDPSVEAYQAGGNTYFYISSIFIPFNVPENALSVTACKVSGSGATATLACSQPIVAAISSDCFVSPDFTFCSFLDKEFLSIDAARGKLYMSYTEFGITQGFNGIVEVAVCNLSHPAVPTCHNGGDGSIFGAGASAPPYFVVAPGDPKFCENEGSYPAVDRATGDLYVAYEHNWFTAALAGFPCNSEPTQEVINFIRAVCLTSTPTSPCAAPDATEAVDINSLQLAQIPGYNRFPMNDFPRVAVSDGAGTVSMVWNDTRQHGTGDIFLQSFSLGSLTAVQSSPVRVNSKSDTGGWHFLPALRQADGNGNLNVSFYSRPANTSLTSVFAALKVNPRITATPTKNDVQITTGASDWSADSSLIVPNFGDYTDNYLLGTTLFVGWSDGRLGFPQPFEDHTSVH
ncbi:MAG TPA: hypothetical protein VJN48_16705 [Terriglobales bacterium]|nr:hypothetical protein [Terriglobales bacterium]